MRAIVQIFVAFSENLPKTQALVQWCTSEESIFLSFSPLLNLIKVAFLILLLFLILELNTGGPKEKKPK